MYENLVNTNLIKKNKIRIKNSPIKGQRTDNVTISFDHCYFFLSISYLIGVNGNSGSNDPRKIFIELYVQRQWI